MRLREILFISAFLLCFSAPGISSASNQYTMTPQEMAALENIFSQLSNRQEEQQRLLTKQTSRIETLQQQLETSQTEIESSRKAVKTLQNSLQKANESLQVSAVATKREHDRLERQRNTWALVGILALGIAFAE